MFQLRPLGKELYAGAIDACGGKVLANILPLVRKQLLLFVYVPELLFIMACIVLKTQNYLFIIIIAEICNNIKHC